MGEDRAARTWERWLETLARYRRDQERAGLGRSLVTRPGLRESRRAGGHPGRQARRPHPVPLREQPLPPLLSAGAPAHRSPHRRRPAEMAGGRQGRYDGRPRVDAAVRDVHDARRCAVGGARVDDVLLLGLDRGAPGLPLLPDLSRAVGPGQCAGPARLRAPPRGHRADLRRLRAPRVRWGVQFALARMGVGSIPAARCAARSRCCRRGRSRGPSSRPGESATRGAPGEARPPRRPRGERDGRARA